MMHVRPTTLDDLPFVMRIFEAARAYMVRTGNPHQWVNRPTMADIQNDIAEGHAYVCCEESHIVGTFAYIPGPDPTYAHIYNGQWPDDAPYGVIHRLAGTAGAHGVANTAFRWAFTQCNRLRIDTHADNIVMQKLLKGQGFTYCGIIHLTDGSPRLAYSKLMPSSTEP